MTSERPRSISTGARIVLVLVPLAASAAIYGIAVWLMGLPDRAWGALSIVFCLTWYWLLWLGIRRARADLLGGGSARPASAASQTLSMLFRMSGGLIATAASIWMIGRGDRRGWMLLAVALVFVAIRWLWLTRSRLRS